MMSRCLARLGAGIVAFLLPVALTAAPALAQEETGVISRAAPEPATYSGGSAAPATATRQMVVTAHPLASRAGLNALRDGGSAVDAAIAAQMVLGLVEPQSSGIGGGAFLLHWDAQTGAVTTWDGRETAPAAARPDRFLSPDGTPQRWPDMVPGGLSVGVPGTLAMLYAVHQKHGRLPWARLFDEAILLARHGFGVSSRLSALLSAMGPAAFSPAARDYFFGEDEAGPLLGEVRQNPEYAETLERIAIEGPDAFYRGEIADDIASAVRNAWRNPGDLTAADLAGYTAVERPAVCAPYRLYWVCGMGPPSSGGIAVAMTLAMLERFDLGEVPTPEALHLIGEAENLAFADRDHYVADPDFVAVPEGLLDPGYLAQRSALIDPVRAGGIRDSGTPPGVAEPPTRDTTREAPGTSQITVIDADGNAVSMTTTIESAFGSRLFVRGFLLNNELTDFAFVPDDAGRPVANRVEGGKRPRSSMAPTFVFGPDDRLRMILGSPGGSRIIPYVVKAIVAHLDWGLDPQAAADMFNFGARNGPFEIERISGADDWIAALEALGHAPMKVEMTSGLNIIVVRDGGIEAGSDPRREGMALGD
ncbi:gamma-glutamyltransferase 1 [Tepidamorphus gemmatus]|jgi:gamma-glutamyltranspeptidase/glutathione hydrolase|uniref:Glutathione hydrolase proenzyme n=1 Tax=Tepidamorphus gemmatus TaxID=747076 RepID=A0A4R3MHK2_9HYPH|nr:gamma-glutamyltransferase 1 [Tepidamorphus gemmatus]